MTESTCRHCGQRIEHGGSPALEAIYVWFDDKDDFMCPDGEQQHEPEELS